MRVVADTNILISALIFGGLPEAFLQLAMKRSFQLITSPQLLDELSRTMLVKFKVASNYERIVRARISACALIVTPTIALDIVTEDSTDNRVLECAVEGVASAIVTGDRHLLKLGSYGNIQVLSLRAFMDTLQRQP